MLEPYEGKLSRTVLRGEGGSNTADLPDSLVENKQRFISQVTTSKAVSRTCEDIDEVTLSYAEIKAVATGNPLIKEKMEIDNDVQRLKLLKSSYDNQRYSLQDNFMIRYPKLIKATTEKLSCVREDIKARDRELIDNPDFAITVGKFTYTERADGGSVMLEAISKCKTGETTALGSFHGFELSVEKNFMGTNYLILRGKTEYKVELSTSPVGNMVKLENCFNGMEKLMGELGLSVEDDRAYDNVGAWLTNICGELADNHVKIKPEELLDLCVNKIRKAIEDKAFYIYG